MSALPVCRQLDLLELKIGKVVYKDYSGGGKPVVQTFNINLNERYKNITDPNALVSLIVFKALINTTLSNIVNLDFYKGIAGNTLASAQKVAGAAVTKAKAATEGATKALGNTAKGLGEAIKLPFGGKREEPGE